MGLALMLEGAVWLAAPESMRRFMLLPDGAPLLRPDGGDAGAGGGLGGAAVGVRKRPGFATVLPVCEAVRGEQSRRIAK